MQCYFCERDFGTDELCSIEQTSPEGYLVNVVWGCDECLDTIFQPASIQPKTDETEQ